MEKPHRKLAVWSKSVELSVLTYKITETFPKHEQYGLSSQMRRSAVSVASNLAEGAARSGRKELVQFLNIARGSLSELDTQVEVAFRIGYLSAEQRDGIDGMMIHVDRMLYGFWNKVKGEAGS